jgi:hypothetical protein
MTVHDRDDIYLDKIIRRKFTASFMNDSKWVKLISSLVDNAPQVKKCLVKLIWDDNAPLRQLIIDGSKRYDFDFYKNAMEAMITGNPKGWYSYKEIEFIDFPRYLLTEKGTTPEEQDLGFIQKLAEKTGQFNFELRDDSLRIYAYR